MRTTTFSARGVIRTNEFESVIGKSLIYCFGNYLPYNILKAYEVDDNVKLKVVILVDEIVRLSIVINDIKVFDKSISHDDGSIVLALLDEVETSITNEIL
jgi:hypothetical protein